MSAIVLLTSIALWLWRLSIPQMTDLSLEASLVPRQEVVVSLNPKPSTINVWYKKVMVNVILPFIKKATNAIILPFFKFIEDTLAIDIDIKKIFMAGFRKPKWHFEASKWIKYIGKAILPKKVYVNDSHTISINLEPISTLEEKEPLRIIDIKNGKLIILQIPRNNSVHAGFPVPPGFVVTTEAYDRFVADNSLGHVISAVLNGGKSGGAGIRDAFRNAPVPPEIEQAISKAYLKFGREPIAVRSSATAEDLPGAAFAGQQDTFLNVIGEEALLELCGAVGHHYGMTARLAIADAAASTNGQSS